MYDTTTRTATSTDTVTKPRFVITQPTQAELDAEAAAWASQTREDQLAAAREAFAMDFPEATQEARERAAADAERYTSANM